MKMLNTSRGKWSGGSVPRRWMSPANLPRAHSSVSAPRLRPDAISPVRSNACGRTRDGSGRGRAGAMVCGTRYLNDCRPALRFVERAPRLPIPARPIPARPIPARDGWGTQRSQRLAEGIIARACVIAGSGSPTPSSAHRAANPIHTIQNGGNRNTGAIQRTIRPGFPR
jgi:hypothetical protein